MLRIPYAPLLPVVLLHLAGGRRAQAEVSSAPVTPTPSSGQMTDLNFLLFTGGAVIFVAVACVVVLAIWGPPRFRAGLARPVLIVGAGIVFPLAVLTGLLLYSFNLTSSEASEQPAVRIHVVGELWWWRVSYLDAEGGVLFDTANEIHIPTGKSVEIVLTSDNVIHSFWVPELTGKLDMIPGHTNRLRIRAQAPGVYRGQCAEYCGAQHTKMAFMVQAVAPEAFNDWVGQQMRPAAAADGRLRTGAQLFQQACSRCHTVRGTEARGTSGPDLTHVGGRMTLGAGVLRNNLGAMAGWIAGNQDLKPGNPMPAFRDWSGVELLAVARYMDSLK
ncbi:cytochrome c oxidase subunit II [Bordetella sp. 02P26C-1]|uniref:cytochrome c oxidase subunit II n=1 Tax=Bordetella sp. 02P26C-1 TaxID=2683195 RepID=UPI001EFF6B2B|nr:cytochrome c oxidase subunit II [Bordetella sp. 02P26C-1]